MCYNLNIGGEWMKRISNLPAEKFLYALINGEQSVYQNLIEQGESEEEILQRILDFIDEQPSIIKRNGVNLKVHKDVVIEFFGLKDGVCKTYQAVSLKYNISRERVRQLLARTLREFRNDSERFLYTKKDFEELQIKRKLEEENKPTEIELMREKIKLGELKLISLDDFFDTLFKESKGGYILKLYNCLIRADINNLYDLTQLTEEDIRNLRLIGEKLTQELQKALNELGLSLKSNNIETTTNIGI